MYIQLRYLTVEQQATERGLAKLSQASLMRHEGKPEKWARDVERKALRAFEHSLWLRTWGQGLPERPSFLPPSSYSSR
jgi:hypothetical protein